MKTSESVINYDVYEDAVNMYGTASVTLPDISNMTQTISGAGIAGEIESVILGHFSAMQMTINFRTVTEMAVKLTEQREHLLELRVAQQSMDSTAGVKTVDQVKYVAACTPKKLGLGSLAPASPSDASGDYSVRYIAGYIGGTKMLEIDPLNYICFQNGKDYLADVRKALGR
jgi:P2 family phage contractile tail tube protein